MAMSQRLTADVIARSPAFLNALKDRELDLRGNKIAVIENLAATHDQFDSIDLSDNEILKVECMAPLPRLQQLLLNNNRVTRIAEGLGRALPNLRTLVLTNNRITTLTQLEPLAQLPSLAVLSLTDNPVTKAEGYRAFVVALLPRLRALDYKRVKPAERERAEAAHRARGAGGKPAKGVARAEKSAADDGEGAVAVTAKPTEEQVAQIKAAIANASSIEEVQRLQSALEAGNFAAIAAAVKGSGGGEE